MRYFYFFCVSLLFLSSCTPLRVVRLSPAAETTEYSYGEQLVRQTANETEVTVSYYDASPNYLVFNVSVENKGDTPINFDPATCSLAADIGPEVLAIDPEFQLLSMDIDNMREVRKSRTWAWIGAGVIVAGAVAGATLDDGEPLGGSAISQELAFSAIDATVFAVAQTSANANARYNAPPGDIPVPENRYFWLDHSLRITTIQPGEVAFGKVVFPRNDEAASFTFKAVVEGAAVEVPFTQRVFR